MGREKDQAVVAILNGIEKRRNIWDKRMVDHYSSEKKIEAWEDLSKDLCLPVAFCQKTFKHVRQSLNKHNRRHKGQKTYDPYLYEHDLLFMAENKENESESPYSPLSLHSNSSISLPSPSSIFSMKNTPKISPTILGAKVEAVKQQHLYKGNHVLQEAIEGNTQSGDYWELLCLSMADHMRSLPSHSVLGLQIDFLKVLTEKKQFLRSSDNQSTGKAKDSEEDENLTFFKKSALKLLECNDDDVIVTKYNLKITGADLKSLSPGMWLNDQIVNFGLNIIKGENNVKMFDSFFFNALNRRGYDFVRTWNKDNNIFDFELLIVPIHDGKVQHWTVAIVDVAKKTIRHYNSIPGLGNQSQYLETLLSFIKLESERIGHCFDEASWNLLCAEDVPRQGKGNSWDCGMFLLMYVYCVVHSKPLVFGQEDMPELRHKLIYQISSGKEVVFGL